MCRHGCPRCKWADSWQLWLQRWWQRLTPQYRSQLRVASSCVLNFRFLAKRRAQLNGRNTRVAKLRAAVHALNHHFDFIDWLGVISHANQIWVLECLVGNGLSECLLVV